MIRRMDGPGCAALRRGALAGLFLALGLVAGAARGTDNASFVSYSGVPTMMEPGDSKTVTVRMLNTGTSTWRTSTVVETDDTTRTTTRTSYGLNPIGDDVWGIGRVVASGGVAPNSPYDFPFTITAPTAPGSYTLRWRMARRTIVHERPVIPAKQGEGFGAFTPIVTIVVKKKPKPPPDTAPSFGKQTVAPQEWLVGKAFTPLTLPEATGGNGALSYSLTRCLPGGVTRSGRRISGRPNGESSSMCTWTVTDSDANTAGSDSDKLSFSITVKQAAFVVSPERLNLHESTKEDNHSGTFTVKLGAKPLNTVTVSLAGWDDKAVTVDPARLTFSPAKFRDARTVKVTALQDDDASNEATQINLSGRGGGYDGITSSVAVSVTDDDVPDLIVNPESLTVKEGESGDFTVKLATKPSANVTVALSSRDTGIATVNLTSLTFSPGAFDRTQTVTVTSVHDRDFGNRPTIIDLSASAGGYDNVDKTVKVTVTNDDEDTVPRFSRRAGRQKWVRGERVAVTLPPATGGNWDLEYALSPDPPAGVGFNGSTRVLSGTPTIAQQGRTYTYVVADSDGNTEANDTDTQTFTIEVVEPEPDPDPDPDPEPDPDPDPKPEPEPDPEPDPDPNTPPVFSGKVPAQKWTKDKPVSVTLPGATGGEGDLTYKLTPKPPDGVAFDPASRLLSGKPTATQAAVTYTYTAADSDDDTSAGDMARQSFTITVALPDTAPEFTEQAPDRHWVTGQAIETVTLPAATGGNGELTYGLSPDPPDGVAFDPSTRTLSGRPTAAQAAVTYTYTAADADANTEDGDTATQTFSITVRRLGLLVSETELEATEGGPEEVFTVRLASEPSDTVTVQVRSADPEAVSVRPSSLTFTPRLWSEPMGVAVTGVQDPGFMDESVQVGLLATGGGYDEAAAEVTVIVDDDDRDTVPELKAEWGPREWLAGQLITPVVLPAGTGGNAPLRYSLSPDPPEGVAFDSSTRTLSGTPAAPVAATTYTYTAADSDENTEAGDAATAEFTITVKQPALVSSKASLAVEEGGAGGTFTVKLAALPKADVTVSVTSDDGGAASVNPASLTFTAANHNVARTVTVKGVEDDDFDDETTEIELTAAGGGYDGVAATVSVTVDDDETDTAPSFDGQAQDREWTADRPITTVTLPEATGGNGELTYTLSPDPPEGVTFDPGTRTLTGTPKSPQDPTEYTWKAADADRNTADDDAASQTFTITVKRVALVLSTTRLELKEGETDQTLTVRLGSPPTEDVTVSLAMDREIVTTDPRQLIFTPTNHAAPRTVTAKGAQDEDFDDESTEITLTASGGGYDGETATVTVTVDDDETDTAPAFSVEVDDIEWIANRAFEPFALPEASGGNGKLTYTLSPEPPASVTFDPATRTLSGTPTGTQAPTLYTYTATDADGNTGAADAATLTFTIEVWLDGLDDASFVSHAGVPETMLAGGKATVTIRMRNTGRTTWRSASYKLGSQRPQDNEIWGLARVALPADVAPDETVELTFAITAPAEVGAHKFRWRMVRGAAGWFGSKTELLTIAVEDPSFLGREIPDQMWVKDETVVSLTLPEARGTGGALTYSLKPALPDGVTFTETTRVLAGTPEALQEATEYRYVAADTGGKKAKLTFEIAVEEGVIDDAAVASVTGLPSKMAAGGTATVTVTMMNTGTTTWSSPAGYNLGSWDRSDKDRWGVRRAAVAGSVAPNETADFTFTVTAPQTPGVHPFTWRMVRDPGGWFGAHTADVSVTVEDPSFGDETIADQTWMQGEALDELVLPAAGGTAGPFGYAISPELPDGVTFAESTRTFSGTPEAAQGATRYSYTATATDGGTATLFFGITVEALAMDDAAFVSQTAVPEKMAAGAEAVVTVRMKNTGTTTWTMASGYALGSQRPDDNERWGLKRVSPPADVAPDATVDFTFTITAPTDVGRQGFRWRMVRGADGWFGRKTELVTIEVEDPSFGDAAIGDQKWAKDAAIATLLLHEADGTAGPFTYSLTPELPDGVTFDGSNRTISGRPVAVLAETEYAYTATDGNGGTATLTFMITVSENAVAAAQGAASAPPPSAGVAFEFRNGVQAGRAGSDGATAAASAGTPGWTADSGDATISRVPTGLALRLRGSDAGGDEADDAVVTERWIPVTGGTYRLSACMLRENANDNVYVDFDGGAGRDGDFLDAHIVATETGVWECGAVTKCIPESVGAVRVRAVREGANLGDAWFDRIELTRIAACGGRGRNSEP